MNYKVTCYCKEGDCWLFLRDIDSGEYEVAIETTEKNTLPGVFIQHSLSSRHPTAMLEIMDEYTKKPVKKWHYDKIMEVMF